MVTVSYFLIPISLQPNGEHLWYFKLKILDLTDRIHCVKYLRSSTLGCKDKEIRKSELEAKIQFDRNPPIKFGISANLFNADRYFVPYAPS